VVEQQSQQDAGTHQKLDPESVMVVIVGGLELKEHEIDSPD